MHKFTFANFDLSTILNQYQRYEVYSILYIISLILIQDGGLVVDKMTFVEYLIRVMGKYESMGKQKSSKGNWWFRWPWPAVSIIIRYRLPVIYIHLNRPAARL